MTLTPTDAEIEAMARALYAAFWASNNWENPTAWEAQAAAIRQMWLGIASDAFVSLPPSIQRVPEGYVVVPIEPTKAMIDVGRIAGPYVEVRRAVGAPYVRCLLAEEVAPLYRAMLTAHRTQGDHNV